MTLLEAYHTFTHNRPRYPNGTHSDFFWFQAGWETALEDSGAAARADKFCESEARNLKIQLESFKVDSKRGIKDLENTLTETAGHREYWKKKYEDLRGRIHDSLWEETNS